MAVGDIKVKAREALKRKQYELSTEMSQEYLGLQPDDEEAMSIFFQAARKLRETRGKSLFGGMLSKVSAGASKDPRKRMASCLRALAKNPEDKSACMTLGQACLDANAFGSAVVAFQQAAPDVVVAFDLAAPKSRIVDAGVAQLITVGAKRVLQRSGSGFGHARMHDDHVTRKVPRRPGCEMPAG